LNNCDYAIYHNYAISDSSEIKEFSVLPHASGASGITEDNAVLNQNPGMHPFITKMIETKELDSVLYKRGNKIVAKIDVEGHELSVINGMKMLLTNNNFFVQIESFEKNRTSLIGCMEKYGYRLINQIQSNPTTILRGKIPSLSSL
jgi:FkbM family methyltransferase